MLGLPIALYYCRWPVQSKHDNCVIVLNFEFVGSTENAREKKLKKSLTAYCTHLKRAS